MSAKLNDNGFDLEAELSPEEKFSLFVNYGFQTEMFLETSLETPFTGWEKQDVRFSLSLKDTFVGQVSATWQNTHHLRMTLEIDRDYKDAKKEISGNFRLSSTISGYERMVLSLSHICVKTTVNTKIEGEFNSHVLKGSLEAFPVKDGYEAEMKLLSPFFEYLELSFDYQKTNQDLSIGLDLTSGSDKSRILLKGNMIDFMNMSGSFISTGSFPFLPDMTGTAVLQSGSKNMNIEVKGKLNGQKLFFLANHEWFISGNEKHANLVLKLVTSSSKVFSGSLSAQMNNQSEFKVDLGVSSSFIPGENIKGHIDGNFSSLIFAMIKSHINLKLPFIFKEEQNISNEGDFTQKVKFLLESDLLGDVNSLQIEISKEYGLMVTSISPLLPTGMCKLELNFEFVSPKDLDFRFSFANAEKSLTSEGKLKWNVDNETEVFVGVRTPFQGYENIKFGVRYIMKEMTEIALFAEPFNLEAQAYYGTMDSTLKAGFKFRTGEDADNLTTAKAVIPLDEFGPEFSALISGMEYNISAKIGNTNDGKYFKIKVKNIPLDIPKYVEISYRAKVPYEFDIACTQFGNQTVDIRLPFIDYVQKFGIVFDSSFLHLAKLFPLLNLNYFITW